MANPPSASNVKLLLSCDGADASVAFTDSSLVPKTVTANGNAQIDTAQVKYGTASALFDGSGDYLSVPNSADWYFGSGPFTVECWVRYNSVTDVEFISQWNDTTPPAAWKFGRTSTNFQFNFYDTGGTLWGVGAPWTPSTGTWYHLAADRDASGVLRIYLNGAVHASASLPQTFYSSAEALNIGRINHSTPRYMNGWIDDVRIVKGEAVYGGAFTPPVAALPDPLTADPSFDRVSLLLHGDGADASPVCTDSSYSPSTMTVAGNAQIDTAQSVFGGAAMLFDGTGDYWTTPAAAKFNMGSGDFCIEGRVRFAGAAGARQFLLGQDNSTGTTATLSFWVCRLADGKMQGTCASGGVNIGSCNGTTVTAANTWYTFCYERQGNTFRLMLDGAVEATATSALAVNSSANQFSVGRLGEYPSETLNGWLDEIRITRGLARYGGAYTPAVLPFGSGTIGADVAIDSVVHGQTAKAGRCIVFTTASIGYFFYIDSDLSFGYKKTTDGGATWGSRVAVYASPFEVCFDVWYDRWTPGNSGTRIHVFMANYSDDDARYRYLDTAGDTMGTDTQIHNGSNVVGAGRGVFISGTVAKSGRIYCLFNYDGSTGNGFAYSDNAGSTWTNVGAQTFVNANDNTMIYPATTDDTNDIWGVSQADATEYLMLKWYDSSEGISQNYSEVAICNVADEGTQSIGEWPQAVSVRHSDGHLIIAAMSEYNTGTADLVVYDVGGPGDIRKMANIATDKDGIYYPQVFIDQTTETIYVAYNGKRDGSEPLSLGSKVYYTYSTDDGRTWAAGDAAYSEQPPTDVYQVWAPLMGPRFYVAWRDTAANSAARGSFTNSLTAFAAHTTMNYEEVVKLTGYAVIGTPPVGVPVSRPTIFFGI